jgi:integrase
LPCSFATAEVKRITFHGMRHTCATLLLQAGEPVPRRIKTTRSCPGTDDTRHLRARPAGFAASGRRHSGQSPAFRDQTVIKTAEAAWVSE